MGSKYPDNMFDASLTIIRDIAADSFKTADGDPIKPSSTGELVKRFAELGRVDPSGARNISRDKEYGFRPKIAGLVPDQINYRHFQDGQGASHQDPSPGATFGDDPGESAGIVNAGIGTNPNEDGSGTGWDADYAQVGFEISLVSDIGGRQKTAPTWNPSHMNGENMSTLVISRRGKEDEDKDDDLPHRYFSRVSDIIVPVPTNDVKLTRKRFKGGGGNADIQAGSGGGTSFDPGTDTTQGSLSFGIGGEEESGGTYGSSFSAKSGTDEEYQDGVWKTALNLTPLESPGTTLDQKNEHDGGPGEHGWAAHDYVEGFPQVQSGGDEDADPPVYYPQGGWLYDAKQDTLGSLQDLMGIDGWVGEDFSLPRYRNRFKQKVSIAYLRHDAHFMKRGDSASPPPKSTGQRLSGRIYFTKEFKCPEASVATGGAGNATPTGGGLGPVTGSPPNQPQPGPPESDAQETGTPVCGEMVLDVKKADDPSSHIKHESGEWRPMIKAGGGGGDKWDYSYHSKPKKYSGSGTMGGGAPTPTGTPTVGGGGGRMDGSVPASPGVSMLYSPLASPSAGTMTTQSQMGSPPPESPGNSQNVNIFENIQDPQVLNSAAVFTTGKPQGYSVMKVITWVRASDTIPTGQKIEMNLVVGEYARDDRGPQDFQRQAIVLKPETFPYDKRWRRVVNRFRGLDPDQSHPITVWVERRNDLSDVEVEVWILKHNISFEA